MGVLLESPNGNSIEFSNIVWTYILNLGERYGWKPEGTKKPKNYGLFKTWEGNYDSSDGQIVKQSDSINLAKALNIGISDSDFETNSNLLIEDITKVLEQSIGQKLEFSILDDVQIDFIKNIIKFLQNGDFAIR